MLPVNVKLERDGKTENLTLLGTYFAKRISFGKEEFTTGVRSTDPWWKVSGAWPGDSSRDVLMERAAGRARLSAEDWGMKSHCGLWPRVARERSSFDRRQLKTIRSWRRFLLAQEILGKPGAVRRVYVSALTKPEDALARRDPKSMSGAVYDRWYCTPYPQAIAFQLQEAIPHSHAEQIRQVAQNEGAVLTRIEGLLFLVTLAALLASALAVSAAMATAIFERRAEVGLMKALGAGRLAVASIFFAEATLLAIIGGLVGFAAGRVARAPDWAFDFQFGHFHSTGAVARDSFDCSDGYVCGKRSGDSQSDGTGSGVCAARGTSERDSRRPPAIRTGSGRLAGATFRILPCLCGWAGCALRCSAGDARRRCIVCHGCGRGRGYGDAEPLC